jgi:putative colanic acid biosynthesis acetyltransferase WcaF
MVKNSEKNVTSYPGSHSLKNRIARTAWFFVWCLFFRCSPEMFYSFRRTLLRLFGAKISRSAMICPTVNIWAPWNLEMGEMSTLAPHVICYSVDKVILEDNAIVSQYTHLCTASKDYSKQSRPLITEPILIKSRAWVCADVFVGPGVTVGQGSVVGARACVAKDVEPWTIVGGNPASMIRKLK